MASRNSKSRGGLKQEQGAAAQEEKIIWETIKVDMMRAHVLKKESDELFTSIKDSKASFGGDWKSMFLSVRRHLPPSTFYVFSPLYDSLCGRQLDTA